MNSVSLIGRVTKDIELRSTQNGKSVASFTLAVPRIPEGADFVSCVVWGKEAEAMKRYVSKGHRVGVSGRLQVRSYKDRDGRTVFVTEVVADRVDYLEPKRSDANDSGLAVPAPAAFEPEDSGEDLPF